jgi:hypothetical protein
LDREAGEITRRLDQLEEAPARKSLFERIMIRARDRRTILRAFSSAVSAYGQDGARRQAIHRSHGSIFGHGDAISGFDRRLRLRSAPSPVSP